MSHSHDAPELMEVAILLALMLLNGAFAMSEIAMVTARKTRLAQLADDGDEGARVALKLSEDPTRLLSTVQVGITSISILSGIYGEQALAQPLAEQLARYPALEPYRHFIATALVVLIVTYLSLVIGELVPKRLGQLRAENIARFVSRPMRFVERIAAPFVRLLSLSTNGLLRLMGVRHWSAPNVTEEDITALMEQGADAGIFEESEQQMVRNVFRLDDRQLQSLMTPRADIVYLDLENTWATNLQRVLGSRYNRFPVCRGGLEHLLGFIDAKRLLAVAYQQHGDPKLTELVEPALYVPESLTGTDLLENFKSARTGSGIVVDEYGHIQGLVTMSDLMSAIVGELPSPSPGESFAIRREDGSWLLDGMIATDELKDTLELDELPEEDRGQYHTLNGMLMMLLGRIPRTGDKTHWGGWELEVVDMDGRRIDKVLATPMPTAPDEAVAGNDEA